MTNQEAFDISCRALIAQGKRSVFHTTLGVECAYRGADGLKCAVGHLIPDAEYSEDLEGKPAHGAAQRCQSLSGIDVNLLDRLQHAHDSTLFGGFKLWAQDIRLVARMYDLSTSVLDEAGL